MAASEFFAHGVYNLSGEGRNGLSADDLIASYQTLVNDFPILSIEDGLAEGDWDGWKRLTDALGPGAAAPARSPRRQSARGARRR